jgi:O-antigen/teichoic acid export membrane protein
MDFLPRKVKSHPKYEQVSEFFRLTIITGSAQIIIQLIGLVAGIAIIRLLPSQEYAFYTLANAMIGTMSLLSDGGISTGVMMQGGKVWNDKEKLGTVLYTGMKLRNKFSIITLIVILPILGYLLIHQKASLLTTGLIILSIIPAYYANLSDALLEIVPKLHQDIKPLQHNQLIVNFMRLLLSVAILFFFPWAFIAMLAAGIPRIIGNIKLRAIADKFVVKAKEIDTQVEKEIIAIVKRSMPGAIYYCLSGQITIWILSIFGTTTSLAASGALSRLGMVLNIIIVMLSTLITPRFARLPTHKKLLLTRFTQILLAIVFLCFIIQGMAYLFSSQLLYVLGPDYIHLDKELFVYFLGSNLSLLTAACYGLYSSRGWIIKPAFSITYDILCLIAGVLLFNVSTLIGVLWFTVFITGSQVLMHIVFALNKITKLDETSLGNSIHN